MSVITSLRAARTVGPLVVLLSAAIVPAWASPQSDRLAVCLQENLTAQDRTVLVQWAYVSLGKTKAARSVHPIPEPKIRKVEEKAQTTLTRVVLKRCAKPALAVLAKDPKEGLQDTLRSLAEGLIRDELKKRRSPVLPLTITDLLRR